MNVKSLAEYLVEKCGVELLRKRPDGLYAGVIKIHGFRYLLSNYIHSGGYEHYWVYSSFRDAAQALAMWTDYNEPPRGPWLKDWKGRHNPKLYIILGHNSSGGEYARRNSLFEKDAWDYD